MSNFANLLFIFQLIFQDRRVQLAQGDQEAVQRGHRRPLQHQDPRPADPHDLREALPNHPKARGPSQRRHRLRSRFQLPIFWFQNS